MGLRRQADIRRGVSNALCGLNECAAGSSDDVRFCYTQLYDVEQEVNGLYTYDRRPKFDPDVIRRINSRKAAIED